ncbi:MAG: hypothetical protein H6696_19015 [Deferribacteres bacterium]|nr:hypothetical protein [candidate division KSB1 bacterium]MCB9504021.1 hypothetical protein [Deferribacteres bacterium]
MEDMSIEQIVSNFEDSKESTFFYYIMSLGWILVGIFIIYASIQQSAFGITAMLIASVFFFIALFQYTYVRLKKNIAIILRDGGEKYLYIIDQKFPVQRKIFPVVAGVVGAAMFILLNTLTDGVVVGGFQGALLGFLLLFVILKAFFFVIDFMQLVKCYAEYSRDHSFQR